MPKLAWKWPDDLVEEETVGPGGLLSRLTKGLVDRAMEVELPDTWAMSGLPPFGGHAI